MKGSEGWRSNPGSGRRVGKGGLLHAEETEGENLVQRKVCVWAEPRVGWVGMARGHAGEEQGQMQGLVPMGRRYGLGG